MTLYKLRLLVLRNRDNILLAVTTTAIMTILIMNFIVVSVLYRQSEKIESILKGLSCILLIKPDLRTTDNVADCVDLNSADHTEFKFKAPDDSVIISPNQDNYTLPTQRSQPVTQPIEPATPTLPVKPKEPVVEPPEELEKEFRVNPDTGLEEWKFVGDTLWQVF